MPQSEPCPAFAHELAGQGLLRSLHFLPEYQHQHMADYLAALVTTDGRPSREHSNVNW